jgi:replicative DNA helicase
MNERDLCQALIRDENGLKVISKYKIKPDYFHTEKSLYDYIMRHFDRHGQMPNQDAIQLGVDPSFEVEDPGNPLSFYCEELIKRRRRSIAVKATELAAKSIENDLDPNCVENWKNVISKAVFQIESELTESTDILLDSKDRSGVVLERYQDRLDNVGVSGLPFPWDYLSSETGGMQAGDVDVVSANTGVGKTWVLLLIAHHLWLQGKKVLMISKEMSGDAIEDRFHSLHFKLAYKMFRQARMDESVFERWKEEAEKMWEEDSRRFVVVDDVTNDKSGMLDIEAKIVEYKPDVLMVDGIYLVSDDTDDDLGWKSVGKVIIRLKRVLRKYGIPGIVTTQNKDLSGKNRGGKPGGGRATTDDLAYTKEISRIATLLIMLRQDAEDKIANVMRMDLPKVREGESLSISLNWNFDTMDFTTADGSSSFVPDDEDRPDPLAND